MPILPVSPRPARRATAFAAAIAASASLLLAACDAGSTLAPEPLDADLAGCEQLQAPAGNAPAFRAYARGVQIYRWTGTTWSFVEPSAVLFADADGRSAIGSHYAGPTWLGIEGSRVVGAVVERCTRDAGAIPWLLLRATSTDGAGPFAGVTYVHRVSTTGGIAPTTTGTTIGELASVPYTAAYVFHRAR